MKRVDFTKLGGADVSQNVFDFIQQSYTQPLDAIARLCGNKTILHGVKVSAGVVSDGWISYNGKLLPFIGGTYADKVVIVETPTSRVYADNATKQMLFDEVAQCGSVGLFNFSELKRLQPIGDMWLKGDVKSVHCDSDYIANNFDITGLGINEREGWAICNGDNLTQDMGGMVMVGYSVHSIDPGSGIWDIVYNTMLATGGLKKVALSSSEQGTITFKAKMDDIGGGAASAIHTLAVNGSDVPRDGGANGSSYGGVLEVHPNNSLTAHENRPPFTVTLFIQKI